MNADEEHRSKLEHKSFQAFQDSFICVNPVHPKYRSSNEDFHRRGAPYFATSFAEASSYAKASADKTADKTAVKKATNGREVAEGTLRRVCVSGYCRAFFTAIPFHPLGEPSSSIVSPNFLSSHMQGSAFLCDLCAL